MKIVQTFKTPAGVTDLSGYACGWSSPDLHWMAWVLSAMLARTHYGNVSVYTDKRGGEWFKRLGIPFDEISTRHEYGVRGAPWSYAKVKTFAWQDEPFLHIDSDVFLIKPLPSKFVASPVCFQHSEETHWEEWRSNYTLRKAELEGMPRKPKYWDRLGWGSFNYGIFGGSNLRAIRSYTSDVTTFVECPENAAYWETLGSLDRFSWLIEQGLGFAALQPYLESGGLLFRMDEGKTYDDQAAELGYVHVMCDKGKADAIGMGERLRKRCRDDYPFQYERILELTGEKKDVQLQPQ